MEKDDDINVNGGSYDFGARIYDSRLGRWLSLDPLAYTKSFITPYVGIANNPILYIDIEGEDEFLCITIINKRTGKTTHKQIKVSDVFYERTNYFVSGHDEFHNYEYYNIYHQITITINEDGTETESSAETTLGIAPVYTRHPLTQLIPYNRLMDGDWEGKGDKARSGGMRLTSEEGGISPVKTKCKNGLDGTPIGDLLTALGAFGGALNYKDLSNVDLVGFVAGIIQSIKDVSKKNQQKKADEEAEKAKIKANITYKLFPNSPNESTVTIPKVFADTTELKEYKKDNPTHTVTVVKKKK